MRIKLICVGKLKEKHFRDAASEYIKRISRYGRINIIEVNKEKDDAAGALKLEAVGILKHIKANDYVVTLEIKGQSLSSEGLALKMSDLMVGGRSDIAFIIGGSNGLDKSVSGISDFKLSFSEMTFTHQMMRVILLEQIYRAYKINRGEKYHK